MKRFVHLLIAGSLLACQTFALLPVVQVSADSGGKGDGHVQESVPSEGPAYTFVTAKGQNLSLLVRRALQLYDQKNEAITLTSAAAMFAETNIVKHLESRLLQTGEQVRIEQTLIEEYVQKSQHLSPQRLAAWQRYAKRANFELNHIQPVQTSSTRTEDPSSTQTDDKKSPETDHKDTDTDKGGITSEVKTDADEQRQTLPAFWWFAGLVALGIMYYLLGRRQNNRQ